MAGFGSLRPPGGLYGSPSVTVLPIDLAIHFRTSMYVAPNSSDAAACMSGIE
jgi:hypothetical protein